MCGGILLCADSTSAVFGQQTPKFEFRATWIATVSNIDWPSQPGLSSSQQEQQLISILDSLKSLGFNAVLLQIRDECDAFYNSSYEPWSYWLTGRQGSPPSPYYDPLQFAIQEAHKRGMELHAWINPYRAVNKVGTYSIDSTHVTVRHPDWVLSFNKSSGGTLLILNPGLPQVRNYITSVIMDIVRRYDVDGIHFDDYFYPYEGTTYQDTATFRLYNRGITDIGDWRRDNVNLFVKEVYDSITSVKPWVKFGISPFGIWKNGVPPNITGMDAYSEIYADPIAWLHQGTVDYLAPQLYWPNNNPPGYKQDYGTLMPWWADSIYANGRHFYVGQAAYRISAWQPGEIERQLQQNRVNVKVNGSIFFNTSSVLGNPGNFADSLRQNYYRNKSITPMMVWKGSGTVSAPTNFVYGRIAGVNVPVLSWSEEKKSGLDSVFRYVVYRFSQGSVSSSDFNNSSNILDVIGNYYILPSVPLTKGPTYYAVSALNRNSSESQPATLLKIDSPPQPVLASPSNGFQYARDTTILTWNFIDRASQFMLQIATDSSFSKIIRSVTTSDTSIVLTGLSGHSSYYWKVLAGNAGGISDFSSTYTFTTAFPVSPVPITPSKAQLNVSLKPQFIWSGIYDATKYRLQLSTGTLFTNTVIDTSIADTVFQFSDSLKPVTNYYWRVASINSFGQSQWSDINGFRTANITALSGNTPVPQTFQLLQNYPNPFNPSTSIQYSIPSIGHVTINVYNILGEKVATLVDETKPAGMYEVIFDAANLPSGVYVCRLSWNNKYTFIKMLLLK
ncbi:MAG: family 10 glycosylhydrolase [Candidatus Kryptoniota bacterium]